MESHRKSKIPRPINDGGEYSEEQILPTDVITDILSRLPAKFIARFRCVSKLWAFTLHRPDFTELFLMRSSNRPQVLFAFPKGNDLFFFSIPKAQNHDENVSPVVATFVTKTRLEHPYENLSHCNGLVFLREYWESSSGSNGLGMICNPSTGQSLSIPNFSWKTEYFLGYDPIEKQYKLLSIKLTSYKVLTLGSGNLLWRDILCSTQHYPLCDGVCINGILYYRASVHKPIETATMVVCFDIRSEEFHFMHVTENFSRALQTGASLKNYNGKLGSLNHHFNYNGGGSDAFEIWVLDDPKKHEWSQQIHVLPPLWKDVVGKEFLYNVGMIGTNEIIVLAPNYENHSFYVIYYNIVKESVAKVEVQGMEGCKWRRVRTFVNHVEDLKLLY